MSEGVQLNEGVEKFVKNSSINRRRNTHEAKRKWSLWHGLFCLALVLSVALGLVPGSMM